MPAAKKVLFEYGLPIVIGVALGYGILQLMQAATPEACRLVDQWDVNDGEAQLGLEDQIVALGDGARADLREAFMDCTDAEFPDQQVWVGQMLGREPFMDTRFLYNVARDGKGWPRRTAAVALVDVLDREVDPTVVLPGVFAWLEDLDVEYHVPAIAAAGALLAHNLIPPGQIDRLEAALVAIADRKGRGLPGLSTGADGDISIDDRISVAAALEPLVSRPRAQQCEATLMTDEDEWEEVRVRALQALSKGRVFDLVEEWKATARSEQDIVAQAALENLFRSKDPVFNDVLLEGHSHRSWLVRRASLFSQLKRGYPTMLGVFHELVEDSSEWVANDAILAAAQFKDQEGTAGRAGHILRFLETSDDEVVVMASIVALFRMTRQEFGIPKGKILDRMDSVDDAALKAFMADPEGRKEAAAQYAAQWGGAAVFTDAERAEALRKLMQHADSENVERAEAELAKMEK